MADKSRIEITEELRVSWSGAFLFVFFIFFLFNLWQTIHERWVVEYSNIKVGGQQLIADYHIDIVLIGLAVLAAIAVALLVFRFKQTWRFITSMQLGILLISSITVGTVLGTLVFQNAPSENYIAFYSEPMFTLFRAMHLTDVFDAWWFLAYEVLLAISMITVTLRTKPWTLGRMGPMLIHLGIVVIIIGAFYGTAGHIDAVAFFAEDEEIDFAVRLDYADRIYENPEVLSQLRARGLEGRGQDGPFLGTAIFKKDNHDLVPEEFRVPLGGTVRLDKFEEVYYEEPFSVALLQQGVRKDIRTGRESGVMRTIPLLEFRDDKPLVLEDGLGTLRIKNIYEHYSKRTVLVNEEGQPSIAQISYEDAAAEEQTMLRNQKVETIFTITEDQLESPLIGTYNRILPPGSGHAQMTTNYVYRLFYSWSRPGQSTLEEYGLLKAKKPFLISLTGQGEDGQAATVAMAEGEEARVPGTPYTVELLEFYHHFTINRREDGGWEPRNVSGYMQNPAVKLRVSGGALEAPMEIYVISGLASAQDMKMKTFMDATGLVPGLRVENLYDAMIIGETGELAIFKDGRMSRAINIKDEAYRLDYTTQRLRMLDARQSGRQEIVENFDDTEYGGYAVELELETDSGTRSKVIELMTKVSTFLDRSGRPYMEIRSLHDGEIVNEYTMLGPNGQKNFDDPVADRYFMKVDELNELMFQVRGDYIKEWLSHLTVIENGEEIRTHTVRVNEPLIYNDFYFYQSSYEPVVAYGEKPKKWYTYLRVTKDPGLGFVFLGIGMMSFGMIWAAYIGPRFRTKKNGGE